jgi:glutathione peroxidase
MCGHNPNVAILDPQGRSCRRAATPDRRVPAFVAVLLAAALATPVSRAEVAAGAGNPERPASLRVAAGPAPAAPPAAAAAASPTPDAPGASCAPLLRHTFASLQTGKPQSLCQYSGKVVLIVNTASYCGYTNQYEGLEALYRKYRERGLVVLGFPSNDYGAQEPASNKEIAEFCRTTYGVEFPMFEKASGARLAAHPFYVELIARTGQAPRWNFHKYLVDRSGKRIESFGSAVEPGERALVSAIERMLSDKPAT